jgi:hypothetical protein
VETKVALSRPVCWTIELQTGMAADNGILLVGTKDLSERTTSGTCNRLPICVATLPLNRCLIHDYEILEHHAVDEDAR